MTEKLSQIQGNWTQFELAGEFELSEFELPEFYCIAWNFGFLEYSSSHSRGIETKYDQGKIRS